MTNNKAIEAAGLAGIAVFFTGAFITGYSIFNQLVHFILGLQLTGITH